MFKSVVKVNYLKQYSNIIQEMISFVFFLLILRIVLQLSNIQTTQQPQTITIPTSALQLAGNGQQIVQLATPTKMQAATTAPTQNGTVIMVEER